MARYLTIAGFKTRTIMPSPDVDAVEASEAGWIQQALDDHADWIDAQLRRRYAVPFGVDGDPRTDVPPTILRWLVALGTRSAYFKRGMNPSSLQDAEAIFEAAKEAVAEVKQAAESSTGWGELPLKASDTGDGITKAGPLAYTEASPFVWTDVQADAARLEDESGSGS